MTHINIEIKARCENLDYIRDILNQEDADFKGIDHQVDVYFNVKKGRLKLRKGEIENALIYYERHDIEGPKQSNVKLFKTKNKELEKILTKGIGVLIEIDKQREIYFIDNVKFHLDHVKYLGKFVEIEAIDEKGTIGKVKLYEQCKSYLEKFNIKEEDLISKSYSDLLIEKEK